MHSKNVSQQVPTQFEDQNVKIHENLFVFLVPLFLHLPQDSVVYIYKFSGFLTYMATLHITIYMYIQYVCMYVCVHRVNAQC